MRLVQYKCSIYYPKYTMSYDERIYFDLVKRKQSVRFLSSPPRHRIVISVRYFIICMYTSTHTGREKGTERWYIGL